MIRNILSVIIGLVSSFFVIIILENIGFAMYPPPVKLNASNPEAMKVYYSTAPTIVLLMLILAYAIGSFVGGLVTSMVAINNKTRKAMTAGGILMGLGIYNLIAIPHPIWVVIGSLSVFMPFAYLGGKLGIKITKKNKL